MEISRTKGRKAYVPPGHFGGLEVSDLVPFEGSNFSVQVSSAPPGAGGEMHHHEAWAQVFYVAAGELTFDTGEERFTLKQGESVKFEPHEQHETLNESDAPSVSLVITVEQ